MRTRSIIGKRIVAVHQYRPGKAANVSGVVCLSSIELEGGTKIRFLVIEGESDYHVEAVECKAGGEK